MKKLIVAILLLTGLCALSEEIVVYKTINVFEDNATSTIAKLSKRLAHLKKIVLANKSLNTGSYIGLQLRRIERALQSGDYVRVSIVLNDVEERFKRNGVWVEPTNTVSTVVQ